MPNHTANLAKVLAFIEKAKGKDSTLDFEKVTHPTLKTSAGSQNVQMVKETICAKRQ